jgi:uncharacterized membrane protein
LRLYAAHWPLLLMACLFATLLYGVVAVVAVLVTAPLLRAAGADLSFMAILRMAMEGGLPGHLFLAVLLAGIVLLAVAPLAKGGLYDTVVRVQRGEQATAGGFWLAGLRYWGRLLAVSVLQTVALLLLLVIAAGLARVSPVLGPLLWLLLTCPAMVVLAGFAQYVAIAEERGAGAAVVRTYRILAGRPGDFLVTVLVILVGTALMVLAGLALGAVPVAGAGLQAALHLAWGPYALLYLAVRFESRIAPALAAMGGGAAFHRNPPPGAGV